MTNGILPFQLNVSSNSSATIQYSSSQPNNVSVDANGVVTILNASATPVTITITISQDAIPGYTSATSYVSIQVNESTSTNPVLITSSSGISYFLQSLATYGEITDDIIVTNILTSEQDIKILTVNGNYKITKV